MTVSSGSAQSLRAEIQQCLVESGNFETISNELTERLLKDGWFDEVKNLTKEQIMKEDNTNFTSVMARVEPQAIGMFFFGFFVVVLINPI
ncbi:hypothetical protein RNJ44_03841 [Nakaseomyces bracarensis]|uniref:Transcription and mRNA export factor SUS1 n=1 Tax=Nakaseomyces bracarensis TaxID=273131 RepID=A0ABR4NY34_9SACH